MPNGQFVPSDAILWYYRSFKPSVESDQLLQNNPQDWSRLRVWDGENLVPAMPEGFSGIPSEQQIEDLYAHMQNQELFFFELGDPNPNVANPKSHDFKISMDLKEPEPPTKDSVDLKVKYEKAMSRYKLSQELHEKYGPGFKAAVEGYLAQRDLEQDQKERAARDANRLWAKQKLNLDKADRVISEVMGAKPKPSPDVFFQEDGLAKNATIHYVHFNDRLAPNAYDLPQDSKLDERDAATINFAMLGAQSDIQKFYHEKMEGYGPVAAESASKDGFNMMTTGLFGDPRIHQPVQFSLGEAMRLGKESIEAYNAGDPLPLGRRLAECVRNARTAFTGVGQFYFNNNSIAAVKMIDRILELFEKKPDILLATGLQAEELDFMRGYVQMGRLYDKHLDNHLKLGEATARGTQLSTEEKAQILADAVIRKMVEREIGSNIQATEQTEAFRTGLAEAVQKDQEAGERLEQWADENIPEDTPEIERSKIMRQHQKRFDVDVHTLVYMNYPVEHSIIALLGQPGMMERLRESLMNDPAILEQANKSPFEITSQDLENGEKLDALVDQVLPTVEPIRNQVQSEMETRRAQEQASLDAGRAQAQAERRQKWFDNIKAMLTQEDPNAWLDPNVAADSDRLMIAQANGDGSKSLVNVASLLEGGLQALQNPDKNTIELLHRHATDGNLYFYAAGKDMPTRLNANEAQASAQQLEPPKQPSLWMRFWNFVSGGRFYAAQCNPQPDKDPAAFALFMNAREGRRAAAQNVVDAPEQTQQKETVKANEKKSELVEKAVKKPQPKEAKITSTLVKFEQSLNKYAEKQLSIISFTMGKNKSTRENVLNGMLNIARRSAAQEVLHAIEKNPKDRAAILASSYQHFDGMIQEIKEFLPKTFDSKELDTLIQNGCFCQNSQGEPLGMKFDFIAETALENYQSWVAAERTDNFLQRRFLRSPEANNGPNPYGKQYCKPLGVKTDAQPERQLEVPQKQELKVPGT